MSGEATTTTTTNPPAATQAAEPRLLDAGLIARLGAKSSRTAKRLKEALGRNDKLEKEIADLKAKQDGTDGAKRIRELEGQLRTRDHRAVFDRLARKAGASDDVLDDLWALSAVDTSGEKPDEAALAAVIDGHKKGHRARLFEAAAETPAGGTAPPAGGDGGTTPPTPAERRPGPAAGRSAPNGGGAPAVSLDLVKSDPVYVMNNYPNVVAAAKAGQTR